jgi:hypothetical protein
MQRRLRLFLSVDVDNNQYIAISALQTLKALIHWDYH